MDHATQTLRSVRQEEERASRPRMGPCLGCMAFRTDLLPGRSGGYHVYCERCASVVRTAASLKDPTDEAF